MDKFMKPRCSHMNLIPVQNFPNLPGFFLPIQPYWGGGGGELEHSQMSAAKIM